MLTKTTPPNARKPARREARTNIVLNVDLLEQAKRKLQVRSAREAVNGALERLVATRDYSSLLALAGDAPLPDYDPKAGYGHKMPNP